MTANIGIHSIILWAIALFVLLLVVYIFVKYEKTPSIYALILFLLGFVIMDFSIGTLLTTSDMTKSTLLAKTAFSGGLLSYIGFFSLALYYPLPFKNSSILYRISLLVIFPLLLLYIFFYPKFINSVKVHSPDILVIPGSGFWLFNLFAFLLFISAIFILIKKLYSGPRLQQNNLKLLIIIVGISGTLGLIFNHLFPMLGIASKVYGPEGTAIIAAFVAWVVLKR